MRKSLFELGVYFGITLLIACGSSDRPVVDAGASDAGSDAVVALDTQGTDVPATDGGAVDTGPDPTPVGVLRTSYVSANSYLVGTVEAGSVVAGFYDLEPSPFTFEDEVVGPCELRTTRSTGEGGPLSNADIGAITVDGARESIELTPATNYSPHSAEGALWAGGETLRFASGGGDYEPFMVEIAAPNHVEITSPLYPLPGDLDVDRASDLVFQWNGDSAGRVIVALTTGNDIEPSQALRCSFVPSAGSGTVPSAALLRLPAGEGSVSVNVVSEAEAFVPEWGTVRVSADVAAVRPARQYLAGVQFR